LISVDKAARAFGTSERISVARRQRACRKCSAAIADLPSRDASLRLSARVAPADGFHTRRHRRNTFCDRRYPQGSTWTIRTTPKRSTAQSAGKRTPGLAASAPVRRRQERQVSKSRSRSAAVAIRRRKRLMCVKDCIAARFKVTTSPRFHSAQTPADVARGRRTGCG
jgi:hypothetical protein